MQRRFPYRPGRRLLLPFLGLALASPALAQKPVDRLQAYQQHVQLAERSPLQGVRWQFIGPTVVSGRVTDVEAVLPRGRSYTIYIGSASGGVWKTVNEGVTWQPGFQQAAATSSGDIALVPRNPDVLWVGTGEANIFRSSQAGVGIYRTADGGKSWQHMGLTDTHTIARILVHPADGNIVYVAAGGHEWTRNPERGVFRTLDGGKTWEKVLYVNDETGANDLVMDPRDSNTLYAALWQRTRKKWNDPRNEAGYTGSGIYRTTDGGKTWEPINNGLPEARFRGRIGIGLSRSNPNVLYAFIDDYEVARPADPGATDSYGRPMAAPIRGATLYRSDDRGSTWRQVSPVDQYMERASGTYGWVFSQVRVDPTNENRVYLMGLNINVSDDGGKSWRRLSGIHVDQHGLWIDPDNPNYLVNANDGGVYVSYDMGANWRSFTGLLPLVQFFNVSYDLATPFHVYGSIQDHGSYRGVVDLSRGRDAIPVQVFESAPGGEGSIHAIDPRDPDIVYSAGFYGNISRSDLRAGADTNITPKAAAGEAPLRGQWLAPFLLSPHNPSLLYHGFQYLHRSLDRGETWERISPDLTANDTARLGDIPYQTIFSISESPLRFGLIYAGTDDGRVHVTRDGGKTWTRIAEDLPSEKFIAELVASAYAEGTVYLVQNGKRDDDFTPYVWKSTDYGRTWSSIAAGIPLGPVNVIKEDPKRPDVLYLGTDLSVYVSLNGGREWHVLASGLPTTYVHDLVVHPRDDVVVAATHGRGIWVLDARPVQRLTPAIMQRAVEILSLDPAQLARAGQPAQAAQIYVWLKQAGAARLRVLDGAGKEIRTFDVAGTSGLNFVSWDLAPAPPPGAPQAPAMGRRTGGRGVPPGLYTVEVTQGSATATGVLQVSR
ncbi:MAG: hypothetical protein FIB01_01710 [Gemmatimonadetes bacterium]|nr:hypothetical protein [Gemmatimonadota bacterium]